MKTLFLSSLIVFCILIAYLNKRHSRMEEKFQKDFWDRESRANSTRKKSLANLSSIGNQAGTQLKKLNELVDATNENSKTEEEIRKETAELKAEMKKTAEALTEFINGFMHFADGVQLKEGRKDEVRRDCTNALKKIDGEVVSNENNEDNKK